MTDIDYLAEIEEALRKRQLEVEAVEDTFNVRQGTGPMARRAHIDPRPLLSHLSEDIATRRRGIAGFAAGVKSVLLEPKRSRADEYEFVDGAGRILPTIQAATFSLGVESAAGHRAWTIPFLGDLVIAYILKLDQGLRPLMVDQVDRWDVSDDRITAAARSLLFHRTRNLEFEPHPSYAQVRRIHAGDGHDAARCLVVGDVFYTELGEEFRFALPSPDHFLCIRNATEKSCHQLHEALRQAYDTATYPLSDALYRLHNGTPRVVEESCND